MNPLKALEQFLKQFAKQFAGKSEKVIAEEVASKVAPKIEQKLSAKEINQATKELNAKVGEQVKSASAAFKAAQSAYDKLIAQPEYKALVPYIGQFKARRGMSAQSKAMLTELEKAKASVDKLSKGTRAALDNEKMVKEGGPMTQKDAMKKASTTPPERTKYSQRLMSSQDPDKNLLAKIEMPADKIREATKVVKGKIDNSSPMSAERPKKPNIPSELVEDKQFIFGTIEKVKQNQPVNRQDVADTIYLLKSKMQGQRQALLNELYNPGEFGAKRGYNALPQELKQATIKRLEKEIDDLENISIAGMKDNTLKRHLIDLDIVAFETGQDRLKLELEAQKRLAQKYALEVAENPNNTKAIELLSSKRRIIKDKEALLAQQNDKIAQMKAFAEKWYPK